MLPLKLPQRALVCTRNVHRTTFATARSRTPPRHISPAARSRPSRGPKYPRRPRAQPSPNPVQDEYEKKPNLSDALRDTKDEENSLLSPVHIPEDPSGVLNEKHPAASILANSGIVVQRQLELMNVMIGFEQANKYVILDPQGNHVGFLAEQDNSMGKTMARQMFSTHRSFTAHVFDKHEREVLRFHRPFSWVSSRIRVYDPVEVATGSHSTSQEIVSSTAGSLSAQINQTPARTSALPLSQMRIIGEAQQQWAPLRRKYNLFLFHRPPDTETSLGTRRIASGDLPLASSQQLQVSEAAPEGSTGEYNQFGYVDEPFLSWDFALRSANSQLIGSVNRNWGGIGREFFTDTGVYALRMDAAGLSSQQPQLPGSGTEQKGLVARNERSSGMTLDQRAVMLATAVSIDFDYFSRHSGAGSGMGWMPLWFPMGGGEAAAAGEAAEGAGAVGEAAEGSVIRGADLEGANSAGAGAAAGMGTMAGYEAMQRGTGRGDVDDASPTAAQDGMMEGEPNQNEWGDWSDNVDPFDNQASRDGGDGGGAGPSDSSWGSGSGGESEGGGGFDVDDWF